VDREHVLEERSSCRNLADRGSSSDCDGAWSDCWPDNVTGECLLPATEQKVKANSPQRVLMEFGVVILVAEIAALLANLLIR
jgi:hypothetical protein